MKVYTLMNEYFEKSSNSPIAGSLPQFLNKAAALPVIAFQDKWEVVDSPRRLVRDYEFTNFSDICNFINELLEYQEHINHHAKITIEYRTVRVEVWTHDINDVTEIDKEFAALTDKIYEDVSYYELPETR